MKLTRKQSFRTLIALVVVLCMVLSAGAAMAKGRGDGRPGDGRPGDGRPGDGRPGDCRPGCHNGKHDHDCDWHHRYKDDDDDKVRTRPRPFTDPTPDLPLVIEVPKTGAADSMSIFGAALVLIAVAGVVLIRRARVSE